MGFILVTMVVIVAVCTLIGIYVAFPFRGEQVPGAPWLGDAMNKAVDRLPTLESETVERPVEHSRS